MPQSNKVSARCFRTRVMPKHEYNDLDYISSFRNNIHLMYDNTGKNTMTFSIVQVTEKRYIQVGELHLKKNKRFSTWKVDTMFMNQKVHGYGLGEWVYTTLVRAGIAIETGSSQSPGAKSMWSRLLEKLDGRILCTGRDATPDDLDTNLAIGIFP